MLLNEQEIKRILVEKGILCQKSVKKNGIIWLTFCIKLYYIDFENRISKLEKLINRKQQYIPLSSKLSSILKDYLSYWDSAQDDYLFPNGYRTAVRFNYNACLDIPLLT